LAQQGVVSVKVDAGRCTGCGNCVRLCPTGVYDMISRKAVPSRPERCTLCGLCTRNCPVDCIDITTTGVPVTPTPAVAVGTGLEMPTTAAPGPSLGVAPGVVVAPAPSFSVPTAPQRFPHLPLLEPPAMPVTARGAAQVLLPAPSVTKKLVALPGTCCGCNICEMVCSLTHTGSVNPYQARVKVTMVREEGHIEPIICQHCNPAPCEISCPTKALFFAANLPGVVLLDNSKCIKCYRCVQACPFGAIQVSPRGEILKCDLCGGDPACVQLCQERPEFKPEGWTGGKVSTLQFLEPHQVTLLKRMLRIAQPKDHQPPAHEFGANL